MPQRKPEAPNPTVPELEAALARAEAERDEALAQQAASAEVLGVINASPGDLAPVFEAILQRARALCGAAAGALLIFEGGEYRVAAVHALPGTALLTEYWQPGTRLPLPPRNENSPIPRVMRGEPYVHVVDATAEADYRNIERYRRVVDAGEGRTLLIVPLCKDGAVAGVIVAIHQVVRPFTGQQIALLQSFAAQAVIAMENARLMTETREALEQQTATAEVLQVINASPGDLAPVFDAMLEKAMRLCGFDHGSLQTYDGELFRAVAVRGLPEPLAERLRQGIRPSPDNPMAGLLRGEPFVQIPDLTRLEEARFAVEHGSRSLLCVPLRKDELLLGQLVAVRQEVRPFGEQDIALLQNFAAQAVIAMENARLMTETREALEQQTATAEVLGVINASPADLAPVFDAMLEKAMRLCEAAFGGLWTFEGDRYVASALRNVPRAYADFLAADTSIPGPGTAPYRYLRGERGAIHNLDLGAEEPYRAGDPARLALVDLGGARAALQVPLRKDDSVLGVITIYRQEVRPFTDKQIALLENFAAQAVIAMENARLLTETQEALEQQTATAEVLQVINSSPGDLAPVFDAILEKAHELCDIAQGSLELYDGERFRAVAVRGLSDSFADLLRLGYLASVNPATQPLIEGGRFANIRDVAETHYSITQSSADSEGIRTLLCVPLRRDGALLGMIASARREVAPFSEKEIGLLENFAAQAVIAMENARLLGELRARTDDLQEALKYQTATNDVLKVLSNAAFDLKSVLERLIETAVELCDGRMAFIYRRYGEVYKLDVSSGFTPEYHAYMASVPVSPGPGSLIGRVTASGQPVHIIDAANDPDYTWAEAQQGGRYRTMLGVPMLRDGELIGVISVTRDTVRPFGEAQIELMTAFADQAVIAIENARLLTALRQRTEEVAELNRGLEARVAAQVEELGRVGRLKQFLAPQLAELVVSQGEGVLESHRREIVVVFCDLRGYTGFSETAEPEEVIEVLREYHAALGPLVGQFEGTVDQFSGDGVMVFFNDPIPCPNPAERAVDMAMAMREAAGGLMAGWRRRGHQLGFGVGIAQGYATLGQIGFAERVHYTAIGTVCNLAARLCAEAQPGQILVSQRVATAVEDGVRLEEIGNLALKGLSQAVAVYNVVGAA